MRSRQNSAGSAQQPPASPLLQTPTRVVDLRQRSLISHPPPQVLSIGSGNDTSAPPVEQPHAYIDEQGVPTLNLPTWWDPNASKDMKALLLQAIRPDERPASHGACRAVNALLSLCDTYHLDAKACQALQADGRLWAMLSKVSVSDWQTFAQQATRKGDGSALFILSTVVASLLALDADKKACALLGCCQPSMQRQVVKRLVADERRLLYDYLPADAVGLFKDIVNEMLCGAHQNDYASSHVALLHWLAYQERRTFVEEAVHIEPLLPESTGPSYWVIHDIHGKWEVKPRSDDRQGQLKALSDFMKDSVRDERNDVSTVAIFLDKFPGLMAGEMPLRDLDPEALDSMASGVVQVLTSALRYEKVSLVILDCLRCLALLHGAGCAKAVDGLRQMKTALPALFRAEQVKAMLRQLASVDGLAGASGRAVVTHFLCALCGDLDDRELLGQLLDSPMAEPGNAEFLGLCLSMALCGGQPVPGQLVRIFSARGWPTILSVVQCACSHLHSASQALAFSHQLTKFLRKTLKSMAQSNHIRTRNEILRTLVRTHLGLLERPPRAWSALEQELFHWTWVVDAVVNLAEHPKMIRSQGLWNDAHPKSKPYLHCLSVLMDMSKGLKDALVGLGFNPYLSPGESAAASAPQMLELFLSCSSQVKWVLMSGLKPFLPSGQEAAPQHWLNWETLPLRTPSEQVSLLLGFTELGLLAPGQLAPLLAPLIEEPGFPDLIASLRERFARFPIASAVLAELSGKQVGCGIDGRLPPGLLVLLEWQREQRRLDMWTEYAHVRIKALQAMGALIGCVDAHPMAWHQLGAFLPLGMSCWDCRRPLEKHLKKDVKQQVKDQVAALLTLTQGDPYPVAVLLAGWLAQQKARPFKADASRVSIAEFQPPLLKAFRAALAKLQRQLPRDQQEALRDMLASLGS